MPDLSSVGGRSEAIEHACHAVAPAFTGGRSATRDDLLWTAMNDWASAATVALIVDLPNRNFRNVDEVRSLLTSSRTPDAPS